MTRVRMTPDDRKAQLLASAVKLAKKHGYLKVTRVDVAEATGTSEGLINRYFGGKKGLRSAILNYALQTNIEKIIAQGIESGAIHGGGRSA